jgi:septum formation protein
MRCGWPKPRPARWSAARTRSCWQATPWSRSAAAICAIDQAGKVRTRVAETVVAFTRLTGAEIEAYVASGEGLGKAGGYAIQGRAEALIRFVSGSHSGVIGLPLFETRALLRAAGLALG